MKPHIQILMKKILETGSDFQWRQGGEVHLYKPKPIHTIQLLPYWEI